MICATVQIRDVVCVCFCMCVDVDVDVCVVVWMRVSVCVYMYIHTVCTSETCICSDIHTIHTYIRFLLDTLGYTGAEYTLIIYTHRYGTYVCRHVHIRIHIHAGLMHIEYAPKHKNIRFCMDRYKNVYMYIYRYIRYIHIHIRGYII